MILRSDRNFCVETHRRKRQDRTKCLRECEKGIPVTEFSERILSGRDRDNDSFY